MAQPPSSLQPQQLQLQGNSTSFQTINLETSQHHQFPTESGLPSLPQNPSSWTDLTSPKPMASGQMQQDPTQQQQFSHMNNPSAGSRARPFNQQPLSTPTEMQQPQLQQMRRLNETPAALPAEAVFVPHTVGQVGSHVFPIANGQYQIRVILYMDLLIPMVPCPAQPPAQ